MPMINPGDTHTNRLESGERLDVVGQAIVEIGGATHAVPANVVRRFGPYRNGASYRITAIDAVYVNKSSDNANARYAITCLQALSFGDSGLAVAPGTAETFIGPEILIPGGTIKPGDIIRQISFEEFSGTLDAGARTLRGRLSATPGVDGSSPLLSTTTTTSTGNIVQVVDKINVFTSNAQRRSLPNSVFASGANTSPSSVATLPDLSTDCWLRLSAQNAAVTTTQTIFHFSLWLERGVM
jgi:hypothetical protein